MKWHACCAAANDAIGPVLLAYEDLELASWRSRSRKAARAGREALVLTVCNRRCGFEPVRRGTSTPSRRRSEEGRRGTAAFGESLPRRRGSSQSWRSKRAGPGKGSSSPGEQNASMIVVGFTAIRVLLGISWAGSVAAAVISHGKIIKSLRTPTVRA